MWLLPFCGSGTRLPDLRAFVTALKALSCLLSALVLFPLTSLYLESFIFGSNAAK